MRAYEKPEMKFNDIRANESVAATCWGLAGATGGKPGSANYSGPFYWDDNNDLSDGFYSFMCKSADGSCGSPNAYNIKFHEDKKDDGTLTDSESIDAAIEKALVTGSKAKGNNAQNYNDMIIDFPATPDQLS